MVGVHPNKYFLEHLYKIGVKTTNILFIICIANDDASKLTNFGILTYFDLNLREVNFEVQNKKF